MKHHAHMVQMNPLGNVVAVLQRARRARRQAERRARPVVERVTIPRSALMGVSPARAVVSGLPQMSAAPAKQHGWLRRAFLCVTLGFASLFRRRGR